MNILVSNKRAKLYHFSAGKTTSVGHTKKRLSETKRNKRRRRHRDIKEQLDEEVEQLNEEFEESMQDQEQRVMHYDDEEFDEGLHEELHEDLHEEQYEEFKEELDEELLNEKREQLPIELTYDPNHEIQLSNSIAEVITILKQCGLYSYCLNQSSSSGHRQNEAAKQLCKRVAEFLCWSYNDINSKTYLQGCDSMNYFGILLEQQFNQVSRYGTTFLHGVRLLTPSTVLNYLSDLSTAAKWRAFQFRDLNTGYSPPINLGGFDTVAALLRK
jgi:hypothetical protein